MSYAGRDPLPDTFKDGSQALVEGKMMPDNRFVAEQVQAKCASKYEAVPNAAPVTNAPAAQPSAPGGQTSNGAATQPSGN